MPALRLPLVLSALFVLAFCLRTPLLGLPLEGEGARLAAVAAAGSDADRLQSAGIAPLLPALLQPLRSMGASPTAALRGLDALCAALLVPLLVLLGLRLGLGRGPAVLTAVLLAVHPLALAGAGGIEPGSGSLGAVLALASLLGLGAGRRGGRLGAAAALLWMGTDGTGLLLGALLLGLHVRREPGPRWQTVWTLLGLGAIVLAALTWWPGPRPAPAGVGMAAVWLLAAAFGLLLPGLVAGAPRLWREVRGGRPVVALAGAAAALALLGAAGAPMLLLPLVLAIGMAGSAPWSRGWLRRALPAAAAGGLLASTWLVSGGLQATLVPEAPGAAGRLHLLRQAVRRAADAAGEGGWIVLAVRPSRPEEQASLADLVPGHWAWREDAGARPDALRSLRVFPAGALESGAAVAVVAGADRRGGIHTFDGAGIFHEEVLHEVGPYVVLRARRP